MVSLTKSKPINHSRRTKTY